MARASQKRQDGAGRADATRTRRRNRSIILRSYLEGAPNPADFVIVEGLVLGPHEGEVVVEVTHLSMDPYPRMRMSASAGELAIRPGALVEGRGIGRVAESRHDEFRVGDWVAGEFGWCELAVIPGAQLTPIDLSLGAPERHLSLLGASGLTAYFATLELGRPLPRETVLVAPGAGSVGSLASQLAAMRGARVVGVGNGPEQCATIERLPGFAAALDCRADLEEEFAATCAAGIDVFIDGLGGDVHQAALRHLNVGARVVLIGCLASYSHRRPAPYGEAAPILFKRARMEGFLLADWASRFPEARSRLSEWCKGGSIDPIESMWEGLERAPEAFAALFAEAPPGKQIVRVSSHR